MMDKGQDKIMHAVREAMESINDWLSRKPTGQFKANIEVNANQGGVGDVFIETKKRGRV